MLVVPSLKKQCFDALENCLDVEFLENNLPPTLLYDFLNDKMNNSLSWLEYFSNIYVDESELFLRWENKTTLSVSEGVALRHLLDNFLTPYYSDNKKIISYVTGFSHRKLPSYPNICKFCFKKLPPQEIENYKFMNIEFVVRVSRISNVYCEPDIFWCNKCKINPLFYIILDE